MGKSKNMKKPIFEKHKMKAFNDFKKLKWKEGSKEGKITTTELVKQHKNKNQTFNKDNRDMLIAYKKGQKVREEKEKRRIEKQEQEKQRLAKIKKRKEINRKLSERTRKGQPFMGCRIELLLDKIESNKTLYCKNRPDE